MGRREPCCDKSLSWVQACRCSGPLGSVDLRFLVETLRDPVLLLGEGGEILACNAAAARRPNAVCGPGGGNVCELLSPEAAAACRRKMRQVLRTGRPARFGERLKGRFLDHALYALPVPDPRAGPRGGRILMLLTRDVTQARRALARLAEGERRFRTVADFTYDWEYWVAPNGRLLYMSPSSARITGHAPEDFQRDKGLLASLVHPDDRGQALAHEHMERGVFQSEFRIVARDGETRWISHFCQPVFGPDGTFLGRRASNRDITDRKRAELALQRTKEQLSVIVDHLPLVPYTCESGGDYSTTFIAPSVAALTGFEPEAFLSDPGFWIRRVHPKDRPRLAEGIARLHAEGHVEYEYRWRVADGSYRWFADSLRLIGPEGGVGPGYFVGVFSDVTERRRAEEALREASRDLERRVRERTRELEAVNRRLREEIRQRGRAEEALFKSRREFKTLADNSPDLIARLDGQMHFLYANPALARVAGLYVGDTDGRIQGEFGLPEPLPEPLAEAWSFVCREVLADGLQRSLEFSLILDTGRRHFLCHVVDRKSVV